MPTSTPSFIADGIEISAGTLQPLSTEVAEIVGTLGVMRLTFTNSDTGEQITVNLVGTHEIFTTLQRYVQSAGARIRKLVRQANKPQELLQKLGTPDR